MKEMTERQIIDLRMLMLVRLMQFAAENNKLRIEAKSRRRQADYWRKKYNRRVGKK